MFKKYTIEEMKTWPKERLIEEILLRGSALKHLGIKFISPNSPDDNKKGDAVWLQKERKTVLSEK